MCCLLEILKIAKITLLSLTHNSPRPVTASHFITSSSSSLPFVWMFTRGVKLSGPVFVVGVVILSLAVVFTVYAYILPGYMERSYLLFTIYVVFGHWLLINIMFHFYKAVTTKPGAPPKMSNVHERPLRQHWKICHKCMQLKAPRTHHCSICKCCVLKMDHHCPWINNCVGHFTHRYFFLFCLYMTAGTCFVVWISWNAFSTIFFRHKEIVRVTGSPLYIEDTDWMCRKFVIGVTLLCGAVACALGFLTFWHAYLISTGQTSIEVHINRGEDKYYRKKGFIYLNPHHYGMRKDWELFLGLVNGRGWRHVLWPSSHKPPGYGLDWDMSRYLTKKSNRHLPYSNGMLYTANRPPSTHISFV